ncbi:MAG TPA: NADH-quinone oxidoreductase subunit N [Syntrophomonadaceae bacterium]|nr:NADH-quinone oxidoreductase subunit N [Syntrophomonadaceae bacterium]
MGYELLGAEILTAVIGLLVLVMGLLFSENSKGTAAGIAIPGLLAVLVWVALNFHHQAVFFGGVYQIDSYGSFFKMLFLTAALLIFFMSGKYSEAFGDRGGEWYSFIIFATMGMMVMACSGDLITLYVGLEVMTVSFYILSAYLIKDVLSAEAGLKYLIMGALSSAVLLFGMSLIYAVTGSTVFTAIGETLRTAEGVQPALVAGIILLVAGFGFKISVVPFHMWVPDIYQGAPTPVTAYLAVASKAAAFAALVRVFRIALPLDQFNWTLVLALLAAVTMVVGNLIALVQQNLKRLLAYSSIAQAGYILVGLVANNAYGLKGVLFYAMVYVFANVGAFAVATAVEVDTGSTEIKAASGLGQRSPLLAAVMTACLLSLAGIPPLAGFPGKFYLFSGAVQAGYLWLAFLGLVMSMISVYYYLNVARVMYTEASQKETPLTLQLQARLAILACLLGTVIMGLYPAPLSRLAETAIRPLF